MTYNGILNGYGRICNSCTVYIILLFIFFIISISINSAFIYFYWHLKKDLLKQQLIKHINGKYQRN